MTNNPADFIKDVMSAPLGELISSIGKGVGEAQAALDAGSLHQTLDIYREDIERSNEETSLVKLMREIGYQPTFYALPETEVEAQVSLSFTVDSTNAPLSNNQIANFRNRVFAMPVNAGNTNKYNLNVQACAKLKFKIVPIPPPSVVTEMRVVPDLFGKTYDQDTKNLLSTIGFIFKLKEGSPESGKIKDQIPAKNTVARVGDTIEIELE